ncbi:hypothetical protein [Blastococcus sp. PRF04-17]|uniref:hypothetical protein n=1 Tax=Blastococcus sp. PRF04-17 TaxID=2933797 RepID=UPI001FF61E85|nr:hypothetical protein [Blastococcus sp. PRF04-17]UOY03463.1 hypothetical protein MVA48_09110 [Blastococcus sp. PRF04-17]
MPAQTSRPGVLLTVLVGFLLLLGGVVAAGDRGGSSGSTVSGAGISDERAAGFPAASAHTALSGPPAAARPAAGRAVPPTGHRSTSPAPGALHLGERIGSLDHRPSAGAGEQLAVERTADGLGPPATTSVPRERASAAAVGAHPTAAAARAPPAR